MRTRLLRLLLVLLVPLFVAAPPVVNTAAADVCHWSTCPSPKSCNSWSDYYFCGEPFCNWDSDCEGRTNPNGDASFRYQERFRDCFLVDGSHCREYQVGITRLFCNCYF